MRFAPEANEIHFDYICDAQRLACPCCAAPNEPGHDRQPRGWQHLHFFQYRSVIHASVPRVRCAVCGTQVETEVQQVLAPWARERNGFTLLIEALVVTVGADVADAGAENPHRHLRIPESRQTPRAKGDTLAARHVQ